MPLLTHEKSSKPLAIYQKMGSNASGIAERNPCAVAKTHQIRPFKVKVSAQF